MWQRLDKEQNPYGPQAPKAHYRRPWIWRLALLVVVLVIAAIVIPIAVVMSRRNRPGAFTPKANVLVPLYVYPESGAWDPLYNAANASSSLNFTVVINPNNGPGDGVLPDDNYIAGITRLKTLRNVKLLGYVPLGYGNNSINDVRRQVQTFSGWGGNNSKLAMDGIFYDESPHVYSDSNAAFLQQSRSAVANATNIKDKTIVFNAGVVPEDRLYTSKTDIIVAFEETYANYQSSQSKLSALTFGRDQTCVIVHSVPSSASIKDLANSMADHANYVFATDLTVHANGSPYDAFGSVWSSFISNMPL